jgi:hypothetical protein
MLTSIKTRSQRLLGLIDKYNNILSAVIEKTEDSSVARLGPLTKTNLSEMLLSDDFWELEILGCREKWVDIPIRRAIKALWCYDRGLEELELVTQEAQIYCEWAVSRLENAERVLSMGVKVESEIGSRIVLIALKVAGALKSMVNNLTTTTSKSRLPAEIRQRLEGIFLSIV